MTDRQEATRSRLLEATLALLAEHGIAGTTSRGIANAAGVNLQAITYHFGSKDELVAHALVHAVRRWLEPARQALDAVTVDPVMGLISAVLALQSALSQAAEHVPAYVEALAASGRDQVVREHVVALLGELRQALATSIGELKDAGQVADWVEPQAMAALVVAAGDGFVLHSLLEPEEYRPEEVLGQVIQLLLAARTVPPDPSAGRTQPA